MRCGLSSGAFRIAVATGAGRRDFGLRCLLASVRGISGNVQQCVLPERH